jgi:hypothetical protein
MKTKHETQTLDWSDASKWPENMEAVKKNLPDGLGTIKVIEIVLLDDDPETPSSPATSAQPNRPGELWAARSLGAATPALVRLRTQKAELELPFPRSGQGAGERRGSSG